ncbi:MAG TPA: MBL fold metallo-hydrolase [Steroidobacteraceae bacterium]|nr:MBL fold metallo-hydrolase [Steroidobacteraceae bacterium]
MLELEPQLWHFHDAPSGTFTHLLACPITRRAALIDPVLGFEPGTAHIQTAAAQRVAAVIRAEHLVLDWVLETHIHADHVSAAQFFKQRFGARVGIGYRVREVQRLYAPLFWGARDLATDGSQFDRLWQDDDRIIVGGIEIHVLATPGHTLDGVTYRAGRHAFVGDTVFRADFGTARTDLIGGDAATLYQSISRLYALQPGTILHFCHDYPRGGAPPTEQMEVDRMRTENAQLSLATSEDEFVTLRQLRDATLPVPLLLIPAVQINIAAGQLPCAEANGISYLRVPLNSFGGVTVAMGE